jgi:hypothetical protein
MNLTTNEAVRDIVVIALMFGCSLPVSRFYKHQPNCVYPISLISIPSAINCYTIVRHMNDDESAFLLMNQFLPIVSGFVFVFVLTAFNILAGVLDGIIFNFILFFDFQQSLSAVFLLNIFFYSIDLFKGILDYKILSNDLFVEMFKASLLFSTERIFSYAIGISIVYYYY